MADNIVDISQRLPPPKFTPRIKDHSRIEAYDCDPVEWHIAELSKALLACMRQIAMLGGVERMQTEATIAAEIASATARRA